MTLEEKIARSFSMSEETWQRHANPWSVWTRFTALPLIILAAWSRSCWWRHPIALSRSGPGSTRTSSAAVDR